jgi:alpha-D-xyloside xylohydrolase
MRKINKEYGEIRMTKIVKQSFFKAVVAVCFFILLFAASGCSGLDSNGHMEATGAKTDGFSFIRLENGVQLHVGDRVKNVIFYGSSTVRVNENLGQNYWKYPSIVVVGKPAAIPFEIKDTVDGITVVSDKLKIKADKKTGALTFLDAAGKVLTQERAENHAMIKNVEISGSPTYEVSNTFTLKPDEGWYGLGYIDAAPTKINRRGQELTLIQTNMGIVIPMILSSERYGIMWDIYSIMKFKDDATGATLWAQSAPGGVDYYFFAGDKLDDVIAGYRSLTGAAPMYPKQALGLFMSKERYQTQARIVEVAKTFRKEQFPLDYIVQDWQYWGSDKDGTWSGMIWNKERYPDPEAMTKAIHDLNMKLMISIWPSVGNDTPLAHELDQYKLRFEPLHWISRKARIYDAFSAKGREIYFKHIKSGLFDKGVDALWMDGTEVEVGTACWNPNEVARDIKKLGTNAMGDFSRYLNPYTLMTTKGTYEGQRSVSNQRVFTLTRSAWCGAQRYAAASWSGDSFASWDTLKAQMAGGLEVTMSGNPWWTQDIGGFFVNNFPGGEKNSAYRELFARWYQFGAFNPIFRIHGCGIEREPYIFKDMDPEMYQSLLDITHLRYRLMPYIYSQSWKVTSEGYTLMRALPLDFSDDVKARDISDAFMFGPALLVHPVTRAMYQADNPPAQTLPTEFLQTPDGQPGLSVQYFAGVNFDTPKEKGIDKIVNHDWPGPPLAVPPGGLDSCENFSARWEGAIVAPEDGEYEIGLEGDDGFRLYLDGKVAVEDWTQSAKRYKGTKIQLHKDQKLPVKIEYFQGGLDRAIRLSWRTPSDIRKLKEKTEGVNTVMETYLPAGANWYDFWTNTKHEGGQTAKKECPLNILPLYVRAGSIIPMSPVMQYATEKPDAPYEIRIYPGANAAFTIYEDDNETYNYEKGQYATYDLMWDDAAKTLSIGPRKGSFPGMASKRQLKVVLAASGQNAGINEASDSVKSVLYTGQETKLEF